MSTGPAKPLGKSRREASLDAWREANPDAFSTWEVKHGCVILFGGWKVYYGRCKTCSAVITDRRVAGYNSGPKSGGRWRERCEKCKRDRAATAARGGMRKTRAAQKARRAEDNQRVAEKAASADARRAERDAERRAEERRRNGLPPEPRP